MLELTTFATPAFWVLLAFFFYVTTQRLRGKRVDLLAVWRIFRSTPLLIAIGIMAFGGLTLRFYMNYLVPADILQDIVGATGYRESGSFYPQNYVQSAEQWLGSHPPVRPFAAFPNLDRLQSALIANNSFEVPSIVHPPQMTMIAFLLLRVLPGRWLGPFISLVSLIGLALCTIKLLMTYYPSATWRDHVLAVMLVVSWQPVIATVRLGQFGIAIGVLITSFWLLARRGKLISACVCLALAASLKLYPLIFFLFLLIVWRRAFVTATAVYACGFASSLWFFGLKGLLNYFQSANSTVAFYGSGAVNISLLARMNDITVGWPHKQQFVARAAFAALLLVAVCWFWLTQRRELGLTSALPEKVGAWDRNVAIVCCLCCLWSPISWTHYFPILLLPCVLLIVKTSPGAGNIKQRGSIVVFLVLLLLSLSDRTVWGLLSVLSGKVGATMGTVLSAYPTYALIVLIFLLNRGSPDGSRLTKPQQHGPIPVGAA